MLCNININILMLQIFEVTANENARFKRIELECRFVDGKPNNTFENLLSLFSETLKNLQNNSPVLVLLILSQIIGENFSTITHYFYALR